METDTSNQAIPSILSQPHVVNGCKQLHAVKYYAQTLSAIQGNWPIYDKELFAIVDCFRKWRDWLVDVKVIVCADYQGLPYFDTMQKPNSQETS